MFYVSVWKFFIKIFLQGSIMTCWLCMYLVYHNHTRKLHGIKTRSTIRGVKCPQLCKP